MVAQPVQYGSFWTKIRDKVEEVGGVTLEVMGAGLSVVSPEIGIPLVTAGSTLAKIGEAQRIKHATKKAQAEVARARRVYQQKLATYQQQREFILKEIRKRRLTGLGIGVGVAVATAILGRLL